MVNAVIKRLNEALTRVASRQDFVSLVVYTSFGILRGELTQDCLQAATQVINDDGGVIEFRQATVEHYSNHLPTGKYGSLFVNFKDIAGFAVIKEPGLSSGW